MPHKVDGVTCFTSTEAAKLLGLKQNTFYWNVHAGNIVPDRRVGREPLFTIITLQAFHKKRTGEAELPGLATPSAQTQATPLKSKAGFDNIPEKKYN